MISKTNIGVQSEDEVQRAVESAFSPFFVFRAPHKEDNKEVTDVFVPWDDVGLIIQVKSQAVASGDVQESVSLDWAKKNLAKAGRQVAGAVRAIRERRVPYIENPFRGRTPVPREIKWLYGIVILHHVSISYDPLQLVPELREAAVPLHVLSFQDFYNLSQVLDTPADLINYLEARSDVLLPTLTPRVHEERAIFEHYIDNLESIMAFRAAKRNERFAEEDARPYAESLRRLLRGELTEAHYGAIIDHMIEKVHERDPQLAPLQYGDEIIEMTAASSVKVATELSSIPRIRRIALGRRFSRTIKLAAERQHDTWITTHSPRRGDCTLFLASPSPLHQRSERQQRLLTFTELLKHRHQVGKAIGIATEAGHDSGRSYDFVYIEGEPVTNREASQLADELFGKQVGLLADEPR